MISRRFIGPRRDARHETRARSNTLLVGALSKNKVVAHGLADLALVGEVLTKTAIVVAILSPVTLTLKVILARCTFGISSSLAPVLNDLIDPPVFGFLGRVYRS